MFVIEDSFSVLIDAHRCRLPTRMLGTLFCGVFIGLVVNILVLGTLFCGFYRFGCEYTGAGVFAENVTLVYSSLSI